MKYLAFLGALACSSFLFSAEAAKTEEKTSEPHSITHVSEAFGHLIGKNIESIGMKLDIESVVKGLHDSIAGKSSPMTEMECIQAITAAQEKAFQAKASENLSLAETFLAKNKKQKDVVLCEEGKVQYKIEKTGSGAALEASATPLIQYTGKYLDGSVFASSTEAEPISLDELIPGLKAGLIGMKEGEKRTVHIHPDLAYGTKGALPPNSLLTFEIELIKNQAPIPEKEQPSQDGKTSSEIALPDQPLEQTR